MMNANIPEKEYENNEGIYTQINREAEALLGEGDGIVFAPALNFEYTVPLEDFKKTNKMAN